MVTALKVTNYLGESLEIDPFDPESSGFLITDIKGITPIKADINFTDITTNDGALFNSARIGTRNITMKLVYFPHPTIEETRLLSYKYFPIKRNVILEFKTENRQAQITGYVESNDVSIFTKTEYSSISILCPDPFFYSTDPDRDVDIIFAGSQPKFKFKIPTAYDESLTPYAGEPAPNIVFGDLESLSEKLLVYDGDSEIGAEFIFNAIGPVGNITMQSKLANESMTIDATKIASQTGSGLVLGDAVHIYTYRGNKHATLVRNGENINILNCLDRNMTWLQIRKGENVFAFTATSGEKNIIAEIKTKTIYEGL